MKNVDSFILVNLEEKNVNILYMAYASYNEVAIFVAIRYVISQCWMFIVGIYESQLGLHYYGNLLEIRKFSTMG